MAGILPIRNHFDRLSFSINETRNYLGGNNNISAAFNIKQFYVNQIQQKSMLTRSRTESEL